MKITIFFFSANRLEFLIPSLDSFFKHVNFGKNEIYSVLIDDYQRTVMIKSLEKFKRNIISINLFCMRPMKVIVKPGKKVGIN